MATGRRNASGKCDFGHFFDDSHCVSKVTVERLLLYRQTRRQEQQKSCYEDSCYHIFRIHTRCLQMRMAIPKRRYRKVKIIIRCKHAFQRPVAVVGGAINVYPTVKCMDILVLPKWISGRSPVTMYWWVCLFQRIILHQVQKCTRKRRRYFYLAPKAESGHWRRTGGKQHIRLSDGISGILFQLISGESFQGERRAERGAGSVSRLQS